MNLRTALVLAFAITLAPASDAWPAVREAIDREAVIKTIFKCAVDADPVLADEIIAGPSWSQAWRKKLPEINEKLSICMILVSRQADMLRISPLLWRGELARVQLAYGRVSSRPYALPDLASKIDPARRPEAVGEHLDIAFAGCLAERLPADARLFVDADPLSPAERTAFAKLQPLVEACQVEAVDYRISGDRLRAALAIMLYSATAKSSAGEKN